MDPKIADDPRPLIVYVEDDPDAFRLANLRLRERYQLLWARTDREALELLTSAGPRLCAVLMDLLLAGSKLDGLALVRVLRGTVTGPVPQWAQGFTPLTRIPIIVVTAHSGLHAEQESRVVGADYFITKPIDFTRLNLALARASSQSLMTRLARTGERPAHAPGRDPTGIL